MHIDTFLTHIESGQRTFSTGRVTRYVRSVAMSDKMIGYATRINGKTKYARLVDFAAWAGKPGAAKTKRHKPKSEVLHALSRKPMDST